MTRVLVIVLVVSLCVFACGCGEKGKSGVDEGVPSQPKADVSVTLPEDLDELKSLMDVSFHVRQAQAYSMKTSNVKKSVRVTIPKGVLAKPMGAPNAPTYVTTRDTTFVVEPTTSSHEWHAIPGMMTDVAKWGNDRENYEYALEPPDKTSALYKYVERLSELKEYNWTQAQVGLFVVTKDIPVKAIYNRHITVSSGLGGMNKMTYVIYSYGMVVKAGELLKKLGYDVDKYRIFKENRENFEKSLANYKLKDWSQRLRIACSGNQFNGLKSVSDEPEVYELVFDYLRNHQFYHYRHEALRFLLDEFKGLKGFDDELYAMAVNDDNRMVRAAAAQTLLKRDDPRAVPLVLVFQYEDGISQGINFDRRQALAKKTGDQISETANLLELWRNQNGWDELELEPAALETLKKDVAKQEESERTYMKGLLKDLSSAPNSQEFHAKLAEVNTRFPFHPGLFETLKTLAATHSDRDVRMGAMGALMDKKGFERLDFLADRLENEKDTSIRNNIITSPSLSDEEKKVLMIKALRSDDEVVRQQAAFMIKQKRKAVPEFEAELIERVKKDPSVEVRKAALTALVFTESKDVPSLIKKIVGFKNEKQIPLIKTALEQSSNMMKTDDMFDLCVKAATKHPLPEVRKYALGRLRLFGRDDKLKDVFMEVVKDDSDPGVQTAALCEAASLYLRKDYKQYAMEDVVKAALRARAEDVRLSAIDMTGHYKMKELTPFVAKVARKDASLKVKSQAFLRVFYQDKKLALDILKEWSRSRDVAVRKKTIECLRNYYGNTPEGKALLKSLTQGK